MRTIRTKVYKFDELKNDSKQLAINKWRNKYNDSEIYSNDITDSVKKMADLFNLKFGREYSDLRYGHIDDAILQLSGVRLYKYLINNYYSDLFKPVYIKLVDKVVRYRQFICKVYKGMNGEYTLIYSKNKVDNSCVLTGVCYDNDILHPVYDFLKRPDNSTFEDLINSIESAISKTFKDCENYVNSDEYIIETIQANGYEFTIDGRMI